MKPPNLCQLLRHRLRRLRRKMSPSAPHYESHRSFTIPILIISYFPLKDGHIDSTVTGDVDGQLDDIRQHTNQATQEIIKTLERGSAYHHYQDATAEPCLQYEIVERIEYLEPLPTYQKSGHATPMTDYDVIMQRADIAHWVEERGVKEVWLWGYHGGVIDMWESNMAGPYGDISNSDRDNSDLPILSKTYTVYHYNYGRGAAEAVEDHIHQIEALLRQVNMDLFWRRFVGRTGEGRCGWAHYPPNGEHDYDWTNQKYVWTDIEDWHPAGRGTRSQINCERWGCNSLGWFTYWMQNLPGLNNNITYHDRPLTNWWAFVGDWDGAMKVGLDLVA